MVKNVSDNERLVMKRSGMVLLVLAVLVGGVLTMLSVPLAAQPAPENDANVKRLRHVVLFKFKDTSTEQQVQTVVDAFAALPQQIDVIKEFEYGNNNSPEGLNDGLTHCFLVTFDSEKGRDIYLPHPAHKAFVETLRPHLDRVLVVDYWAQ